MIYYIGIDPTDYSSRKQIWKVKPRVAERVDVSESLLNYVRAQPGEDALTALRRMFSALKFQALELQPGQYYPCMARSTSESVENSLGSNPDQSSRSLNERANSTGQLHALVGQLEDICRVIHPRNRNLAAYGHEIRNVLILACTEVEAHCKRILKFNGKKGSNIHQYAVVAAPMKLDKFSVSFPFYPWLNPIRPFENWNSDNKTLTWYSAYNAVKHNREAEFSKGTLLCAFQAVSACFVLLCAQYGWGFAYKGEMAERAFLKLIDVPEWTASELYVPSRQGNWRAKHYPF
jgi:hypothetical protein